MKRMILAAAISLLSLAGCSKAIYPNGVIVSETRSVSGFDGVSAGDGLRVEINPTSGEENVHVKADDNLIGYIETFVSNGILTVKIRDGIAIRHSSSVVVTVNTPSITLLSASGGASLGCFGTIQGESLTLSLSGGSTAHGEFAVRSASLSLSGGSRAEGMFRTEAMTLSLSGGSKSYMEGTADRLTAACSGGSKAEGFGFAVGNASLELSGGSSAKFTITRDIVIDASGGSKLIYRGGAVVSSQSLTGGSRIIKE